MPLGWRAPIETEQIVLSRRSCAKIRIVNLAEGGRNDAR
jgi:hypothetical protein